MNLKCFWYPVLVNKNLKKGKIYKIHILNEPFVIFRDGSNNPVCLQDRCPHRGTPLSLGRVVNGELECSYHGWRFGNAGQCLKIPTLLPDQKCFYRANAVSLPCIEKFGAIWVWPESNYSEIPKFHEHLFPCANSRNTNYRISSWDVDVTYELFLENLLDLSHLPFVHHNTLSRRNKAQPLTFDIINDVNANFCGRVEYNKLNNKKFEQFYKFIAPCIVQYDYINKGVGNDIVTQFYCIPINKNKTRIVCYTFMSGNKILFKLFSNPITTFLGKPLAKFITNQDTKILQGQLANRSLGANLANHPVQADILVMKYRKWACENTIDNYWFNSY